MKILLIMIMGISLYAEWNCENTKKYYPYKPEFRYQHEVDAYNMSVLLYSIKVQYSDMCKQQYFLKVKKDLIEHSKKSK